MFTVSSKHLQIKQKNCNNKKLTKVPTYIYVYIILDCFFNYKNNSKKGSVQHKSFRVEPPDYWISGFTYAQNVPDKL